MSLRVLYPEFELSGPRCEKEICGGVKIFTFDFKTKDYYLKCNKCGAKTSKGPNQDLVRIMEDMFDSILENPDETQDKEDK